MLHIVSKFFENIAHLRVRFYFTKNSLLNIAIILVFVSIKIEAIPSQKDRAKRVAFAISNVRFARMRELSHAYKNRFYRFARLFACEKRRKLRAAEKKRPYPIREVPCVLQLTISALADIIGKV